MGRGDGLSFSATRHWRGTHLGARSDLFPADRGGGQRLHPDRVRCARRAVEAAADGRHPPNRTSACATTPHQMSGGMRQRVCIAIAIASRSAQLLLADEPTTALDVTIQRQILDVDGQPAREQADMAMILITHDLGVVAGRTGRVLVMYGGQVVEAAPTIELFDRLAPSVRCCCWPRSRDREQAATAGWSRIPGRPVDVLDPKPGCRARSRCSRVQAVCRTKDPPLVADTLAPDQRHACFFPIQPGEEAT